jgi:hypothetical protein
MSAALPWGPEADNVRAILYHKHSTSARTRFLRLPYGGVCALGALPSLVEIGEGEPAGNIVAHPAPVMLKLEGWLGLPEASLEPDSEFCAWLDTPDGPLSVQLARFTAIDPPFEAAKRIGGAFIALTDARRLPPVELQLLQEAYRAIMD